MKDALLESLIKGLSGESTKIHHTIYMGNATQRCLIQNSSITNIAFSSKYSLFPPLLVYLEAFWQKWTIPILSGKQMKDQVEFLKVGKGLTYIGQDFFIIYK